MHTELSRNLHQFEEKFRVFLGDSSKFKSISSLTELLDTKVRINNEIFEGFQQSTKFRDQEEAKQIWNSKQELDSLINAYMLNKISETQADIERLKNRHGANERHSRHQIPD